MLTCSRLAGTCVALALTLAGALAAAEPPGNDRQLAAQAFEDGVAKFRRAQFTEAARAFLLADDLAPNALALANAITAGRRASDNLLVARAAERMAQRDAEPALATSARAALAEAATRLCRLEVTCDAAPCAVALDGEPVKLGGQYALAGAHVIRGEGPSGARAEQALTCVAGSVYRATLRPARDEAGASPLPRAAGGTEAPRPAANDRGPPGEPARANGGEAPGEPARANGGEAPGEPARARSGLPPAVFFVGLASSAALAAVTTWSGLDTLSARRALPAEPEASQNDDVRDRARRTDVLLAGTVLVAGATAVAGLWLVQWKDEGVQAAIRPLPHGAVFSAEGRF